MKSLIALIIFIQFVSTLCFAVGGTTIGNGGDAVVCPTSIQLLDFFELKLYNTQTPDYVSIDQTAVQNAAKVIARLRPFSPLLAELFASQLSTFFARTTFVTDDLVDVPDSMHVALPTGCLIGQLAIQKTDAGITTYTIDKKLWDRMNSVDQAGLIVHEMIYSIMIASGQVNSISTREVNGVLFTENFEKVFDRWNFHDFLIRSGLRHPLSYLLASEDVLILNSTSSFPSLDKDPERGDPAAFVCGFRLKGEPAQDFCADETNGIRWVVRIHQPSQTVTSVRENGGSRWVYNASAPELGLPFPLAEVSSHRGDAPGPTFTPLNDYPYKNEKLDVICAGENRMGFTGRYVDEPNGQKDFHYNTGDVNFCESLKAGSKALVPLPQKPTWLPVHRLDENSGDGISVTFRGPVEVSIMGNVFKAAGFSKDRLWLYIKESLTVNGRNVDWKQLRGLSYNTIEKALTLTGETHVFMNGVSLHTSKIEIHEMDQRDSKILLYEGERVNIINLQTGKVVRRTVPWPKTVKPYKPGVFVETEPF